METKLSLEDLLPEIPEALRPLATQYGPTLIQMGQEEFTAWVKSLLDGDFEAAYRAILERMTDEAAVAEGETLIAEWQAANVTEAERRAFFRQLGLDLLKALLAILAAAVAL